MSDKVKILDDNLMLTRGREILYIDMDGVLADFDGAREKYLEENPGFDPEDVEDVHGFFDSMEMIDGAFDAFYLLCLRYDVYILSTAPWGNVSAWSGKRKWVEERLKDRAFKRLILSSNKGLLKGHYLIDDRLKNGVTLFEGEHIHFGSKKFPDWKTVLEYLMPPLK